MPSSADGGCWGQTGHRGVGGLRVLVRGVGLGGWGAVSFGGSAPPSSPAWPPHPWEGAGAAGGVVTFQTPLGLVLGARGVGSGWGLVPQFPCENPREGFPFWGGGSPFFPSLALFAPPGTRWCCPVLPRSLAEPSPLPGVGENNPTPSLPALARGETEARPASVLAPAERCFAQSLHHREPPRQSPPITEAPVPGAAMARGASTGTGVLGQTPPIWLVGVFPPN